MTIPLTTQVAIVGAGPAGLLLSHLLGDVGIESIVMDARSREDVEATIRAGILEDGTARMLADAGIGSRVMTAGQRHDGIDVRVDGKSHRVDLRGLTGRSVWLYPQHEVLRDLIAARTAAGQDLRFSTVVDGVDDVDTARPVVWARSVDGKRLRIAADLVVGADGSHSVVRPAVAGPSSGGFSREYPYGGSGSCVRPRRAPVSWSTRRPRPGSR